jgi:hypothetical protein
MVADEGGTEAVAAQVRALHDALTSHLHDEEELLDPLGRLQIPI